jgi:Na+/H+-dicarboxylate symporter
VRLATLLERRWLPLVAAERRMLAGFLVRALVALALSFAAGHFLRPCLPEATSLLGALARGALLVLVAATVFVAAGLVLGLAEIREGLGFVLRRDRGASAGIVR